MGDDRRIGFCPHCGNACTHRSLAQHDTVRKYFDYDIGRQGEFDDIPRSFFLAVCETCDGPLLYLAGDEPGAACGFQDAELVWPQVVDLTDAVPTAVRRHYLEAARIRKSAPTAYAVQIRTALEALCDDRGAAKGGLHKRLQDLAFKNEIPPVLAEMSEMLRVLGNMGAHDHEHEISVYDSFIIDNFFRSIVEYVYEAPKRIQDFRAHLAEFGRSPEPKSDDDIHCEDAEASVKKAKLVN